MYVLRRYLTLVTNSNHSRLLVPNIFGLKDIIFIYTLDYTRDTQHIHG